MKVAYIFATSRHTVSYVLGKMILPQLEEGRHGVDVAGMFFFEDNNYVLVKGNPIGERLHKVARHRHFEIHCDEPTVPLGGEDRYPQPLTYIAAGLGC